MIKNTVSIVNSLPLKDFLVPRERQVQTGACPGMGTDLPQMSVWGWMLQLPTAFCGYCCFVSSTQVFRSLVLSHH